MNAARHREIKEAFYDACQLQGTVRRQFLSALGKEDPELEREVESLLSFEEEDASILSRGPLPPEAPQQPFPPGHRIAERYEIESLRATGGMGEVYRTRDLTLGTTVALKRLLFPSQDSRRRLIEEVLHARRVSHPAVCRVFDVGEDDGELFLTMELLEGEDLGTRIERQGPLNVAEVRHLAHHLIEGLGAAHGAGIIHRDLKPANVVYDHKNLPRLTDFGIAISNDHRAAQGLWGTLGYLAPESLPPQSRFSEGSDFYALGLVLREALTGRPAFHGKDPDELITHMRHPQLMPLAELLPEVDDHLTHLVDWCLVPALHRRPTAASELKALLAGEHPPSLRPAPPSAPGRYELLTLLGGHESSQVHRALDRLSGRVVALKSLRTVENENPHFLRGIDPTRLAEHPHFVPVLEVGRNPSGHLFLTSNLLEGAQELVSLAPRLSSDALRQLVADLFSALEFLHRRGQVHGNLRPSNVLVVEGRLKLLDALGWQLHRTHDESKDSQTDLEDALRLVGQIFSSDHGKPPPQWLGELEAAVSRSGTAGWMSELLASPAAPSAHRDERFSFARPCIGRNRELQQFGAWLDGVEQGEGLAVLLVGESGLGKTRLVEELRLAAWRRGLLVARGQASEDSTGAYVPWRAIWRRLALEVPMDEKVFTALAETLPDLPQILGREATPLPTMDETAVQDRLFLAVAALFQGLPQSAVVILEDLHWADSGSLELLRWLAERVSPWRVLIVATLRPEEPAPTIDLQGLDQVVLDPLPQADVLELVQSLLDDAAADQELSHHIEREAEGNPFFVIETLHEMVLRAGGVAELSLGGPTEAASAPVVRETLSRRLQAVGADHHRLLHLAALAGRKVEPGLLTSLFEGNRPEEQFRSWVRAGVKAWVLESAPEGGWRFRHDKLRELLIEELPREDRLHLHGILADAVAQGGGSNARIAFHGLRSTAPESALAACEKAGIEAAEAGSHLDAVQWLGYALDLHKKVPPSSPWNTGVLRHRLARSYHGIGRLTECRASLKQALGELGHPPPIGRLTTLGSLFKRLPQVLQSPQRLEAQVGDDPVQSELARAYFLYAETWWFENKPLIFADSVMRSFLYAAANKPSAEQALAAAGITIVLSHVYSRWGHRFAAFVERLIEPLPASGDKGMTLVGLGGHYMALGAWQEAQRFLDQGIEICRQVGHDRRYNQFGGWRVGLDIFRACFPQARRGANAMAELARRRGDQQVEAFGLTYLAELALVEGRFEHARQLATEAIELARGGGDPAELDRARALRIQALLASGDRASARFESRELVNSLGKSGFVTLHSYAAVAHAVEVELEFLETGDPEARRLAPRAMQALRTYTRRFPLGEPRTLVASARLTRFRWGHRRALGRLRRAVARADELGMPFEQELTRRALQAFQEGRDPTPIYRWDYLGSE